MVLATAEPLIRRPITQPPAEVMWVPVRGYEGVYEVSNDGRLRRMRGFWCRTTRVVCLDVNKVNQSVRVKLFRDGIRKPQRALIHRLVYEHFGGPIPAGLTINHKDGDREHNWIDNLEVATMSEQMIHAYATGLQVPTRGEARGRSAKLTEAQVFSIRERYQPYRVTSRQLAAEFNVTASCILSVVHRQRWAHI